MDTGAGRRHFGAGVSLLFRTATATLLLLGLTLYGIGESHGRPVILEHTNSHTYNVSLTTHTAPSVTTDATPPVTTDATLSEPVQTNGTTLQKVFDAHRLSMPPEITLSATMVTSQKPLLEKQHSDLREVHLEKAEKVDNVTRYTPQHNASKTGIRLMNKAYIRTTVTPTVSTEAESGEVMSSVAVSNEFVSSKSLSGADMSSEAVSSEAVSSEVMSSEDLSSKVLPSEAVPSEDLSSNRASSEAVSIETTSGEAVSSQNVSIEVAGTLSSNTSDRSSNVTERVSMNNDDRLDEDTLVATSQTGDEDDNYFLPIDQADWEGNVYDYSDGDSEEEQENYTSDKEEYGDLDSRANSVQESDFSIVREDGFRPISNVKASHIEAKRPLISHSFMAENSMGLLVIYTWVVMLIVIAIVTVVIVKHKQHLVDALWERRLKMARMRRRLGDPYGEEHDLLPYPQV